VGLRQWSKIKFDPLKFYLLDVSIVNISQKSFCFINSSIIHSKKNFLNLMLIKCWHIAELIRLSGGEHPNSRQRGQNGIVFMKKEKRKGSINSLKIKVKDEVENSRNRDS
jgi:hypothetical protein